MPGQHPDVVFLGPVTWFLSTLVGWSVHLPGESQRMRPGSLHMYMDSFVNCHWMQLDWQMALLLRPLVIIIKKKYTLFLFWSTLSKKVTNAKIYWAIMCASNFMQTVKVLHILFCTDYFWLLLGILKSMTHISNSLCT